MFETKGQAVIFLATVAGGLIVGLIYDIIAFVRQETHASRSATFALDMLFWLVSAVILAITLIKVGADGFRAYTLMGFACGALIYAIGLHIVVRYVFQKMKNTYCVILSRAKMMKTAAAEEGKTKDTAKG